MPQSKQPQKARIERKSKLGVGQQWWLQRTILNTLYSVAQSPRTPENGHGVSELFWAVPTPCGYRCGLASVFLSVFPLSPCGVACGGVGGFKGG